MTRDEVVAAISAWIAADVPLVNSEEEARTHWRKVQSDVSDMMDGENDAIWLSILGDAALGAEIRAELRRCGILTAAKATKEANWPTGNSSAVMYAVADVFRKEQASDAR